MDPGQLQTIEIASPDCSDDDPNWAPIVQLKAAYTYQTTYADILHCYNQSSTQPVFLTEATYEGADDTSWGGDIGTPLHFASPGILDDAFRRDGSVVRQC